MGESGAAHEDLMASGEPQRVFLTGDPDEEAATMIAGYGGSVFETVTA